MSDREIQSCLFCGGDRGEPGHAIRCDGRQGYVEALALEAADLPVLAAGLTAATYATSREAAEHTADPATQRAHVLATIRAAGARGCTDDEVQSALGLDGSSERPRRWELWHLGQIATLRDEHGHPIRRLTRTNRRAVVWVAA